jgi:hypothetical protein
MAQVPAADTAVTATVDTPSTTSLVDWSAVLAGAVLAAALSFVLLTFGTAIGLSAASPWPNSGLPARIIASLAVFWVMAQQIGAFLAGGYVAGRMRPRFGGPTRDELEIRDGLHGGLVWAVGIVIGAALALAAGGALARAGVDTGAKTAASAAVRADPMELALDTMLRSGAGAISPGRTEAPAGDPRAEVSRILASSVATGPLSDQNRAYLAQRVSQLAGISQQDAESRVNEALNAARRAADQARRAAVLTGFVTAASLVISLAAAWWAAVMGGRHRDNPVLARSDLALHRRPTSGT